MIVSEIEHTIMQTLQNEVKKRKTHVESTCVFLFYEWVLFVSLKIPLGIVTIHIKPGQCRCAVRYVVCRFFSPYLQLTYGSKIFLHL
jgi:hypothetical protein